MEQLGQPGLRQRAASATYDVLAVMLFNIIYIVLFSWDPQKLLTHGPCNQPMQNGSTQLVKFISCMFKPM